MSRSPRHSETGSALLLALGMAGFLSVLAMVIAGTSASGLGLARHEQHRIEARHVADGALQRMVMALLDREERARLPMDGTMIESRFLGHSVQVGVEDEWGKLDVNTAALDLLGALFRRSALSPADQAALNQSLSDAREAAGPGVPAFASLEALRRSSALSPQAFEPLIPYLSVWSKTTLIDPWAARAPVLGAATGAPADEITAFVLARTQAERPPLPDQLPAANLATSPSQLFTLYAKVALEGGGVLTRQMTLKLRNNPENDYQILDYR